MVAAWASSGGWSDRRGCAVVPLVGVGRAAEEVVGRRTGAAAAGGGPRVDQRGGEVVPRTASDGRGAEGRGGELGMKLTLTLHLAIVCVCVDERDVAHVGFAGLGPCAPARDERRRTKIASDVRGETEPYVSFR